MESEIDKINIPRDEDPGIRETDYPTPPLPDPLPELPPMKEKKVGKFRAAMAGAWNWFDGKKTYIGLGITGVGMIIGGGWGMICKCIGGLLIPVGLVHKVVKAKANDNVFGPAGELNLQKENFIALAKLLWEKILTLFFTIKVIIQISGHLLKRLKNPKQGDS
jgi:hypothetical protein